jgi:uncharacterized protein YggE
VGRIGRRLGAVGGILWLCAAAPCPGGSADTAECGTLLTLSATGRVSVTPDQLTATMSAEASAASPAAASAAVNRMVAAARKSVEASPPVRLEAQDFSVSREAPQTPDKGAPAWQAGQTLRLTAPGAAAVLLHLVGTLQQQNLVTQAIDWEVAPATLTERRQQAAEAALKNLTAAAQADARALGLHLARFRSINVITDEPGPVPMMRTMVARAAPSPESDAPQDASLSVTVSGEAWLIP